MDNENIEGTELQQHQLHMLQTFWQNQLHTIEISEPDFKSFQLPLARIKKVMKSDEDVKMISAEVPVIFAKACEIFVLELTLRSWMQTEENKRRTLQKNDVAAAIGKTDTFDFLIDIVPKDEAVKGVKRIDWHNDYRVGDPYFYGQYPQQYDEPPQKHLENGDGLSTHQTNPQLPSFSSGHLLQTTHGENVQESPQNVALEGLVVHNGQSEKVEDSDRI